MFDIWKLRELWRILSSLKADDVCCLVMAQSCQFGGENLTGSISQPQLQPLH